MVTGDTLLILPAKSIKKLWLSSLDWKPLPSGPGPEAVNLAKVDADSGEPLVVVTSRFAKAENDTRVLAVTVKLVGEVVA